MILKNNFVLYACGNSAIYLHYYYCYYSSICRCRPKARINNAHSIHCKDICILIIPLFPSCSPPNIYTHRDTYVTTQIHFYTLIGVVQSIWNIYIYVQRIRASGDLLQETREKKIGDRHRIYIHRQIQTHTCTRQAFEATGENVPSTLHKKNRGELECATIVNNGCSLSVIRPLFFILLSLSLPYSFSLFLCYTLDDEKSTNWIWLISTHLQ